jgi:FG-GAP-like repeat
MRVDEDGFMKSGLRTLLAIAALLTIAAPPAFADLSLGSSIKLPQGTRYDAAFNKLNNLYLITWDVSPVTARLVDASGTSVGPSVVIATEAAETHWATVAAGGTANDPVWLVTYQAVATPVLKYGRIVRVVNGSLSVGPRFVLADVSATWFANNAARSLWDGDRFIVTTRVAPPGLQAGPLVQQVDTAGNILGSVFMGDGLDFEGGPSIACSPDHICMMTGFAQGLSLPPPFGGKGGIWARLFNAQTLQALTGIFYLDSHGVQMDTPMVVFNPRVGKFSAAWYRSVANVVDFRQVGTDGSLGPLDLAKSLGPGAGDLGMEYNPTTGTALLVTKLGSEANLYGVEIGDQGYPIGSPLLIAVYDNKGWPTYSVGMTANSTNSSWLVALMQSSGGYIATVRGGPGGPVSNPQMSIDAPGNGSIRVPFTLSGWAIDLGSASSSGADTVHIWAMPTSGAPPIFMGAVTPSNPRPDIAQVFNGSQFTNSGYSISIGGLPMGSYTIAAFMHSTVTDTFNAVRSISITVLPSGEMMRTTNFDGDALSEITVYNPFTGVWSSLKSNANWNSASNIPWGGPQYIPVPGDYDGDGKTDLGVYSMAAGAMYVLLSGQNFTTTLNRGIGGPDWVPVCADYDGDGKTDFAVYNPVTGLWFGLKSSTNYTTSVSVFWGGNNGLYTPTPGDFDGDGKSDLAVYRQGTGNWYVLLSGANYTTSLSIAFDPTWSPVPADYDGDGKTDFAVYNKAGGLWYWLKSSSGNTTANMIGWGGPEWTPVMGDYDGDGKNDLALYRKAVGDWYILLSSNNYNYFHALSRFWGGGVYLAVPSFTPPGA